MDTAEAELGGVLRLDFLRQPREPANKGFRFAVAFMRRGVVGTLLGGFFLDPHLSLWHNTVHLYVFLALCLVPFTCVMVFGRTGALADVGYGLHILFTVLTVVPAKVLNHWLHLNIDPPPPSPEQPTAPLELAQQRPAAVAPEPDTAAGVEAGEGAAASADAGDGTGVVHTYIDENGEVQHYVFMDADEKGKASGDSVRVSDLVQEIVKQDGAAGEGAASASADASASTANRVGVRPHRLLLEQVTDAGQLARARQDGAAAVTIPVDTLTVQQSPTPTSAPASSGPLASPAAAVAPAATGKPQSKKPGRPLREVLWQHAVELNRRVRLLFPEEVRRTELEALFDRTLSWGEVASAVFFALGTTLLGYRVYAFYDFTSPVFFLSIVIGSAHYSVLKSPQPDAASPQHVNAISPFSRALYVMLASAAILTLDACTRLPGANVPRHFYGLTFLLVTILAMALSVLLIIIICLPLLHLMSMLPQTNTLVSHVLEQWLMLVMGTTATRDITTGAVELVKSVVVLLPAFFAAAGAFMTTPLSSDVASSKLFALCAALLLSAGYFLATTEKLLPADWLALRSRWAALRESDKWLQTLASSTGPGPSLGWLLYDCAASLAILVLVFVIHLSGVFGYTETLAVFSALGIVCSFVTQVVLPQLRRPFPLHILTQPVLRAKEYGRFEVSGRTEVTTVETVMVGLQRAQAYVFYPVATLCLMTASADYLRLHFGVWLGAFVLAMAAGKLSRISFADLPTYAYALLIGLMLANYELVFVSESVVLDTFLVSIAVAKVKEAVLKLSFFVVYTAPWNTLWGSSFHAFIHPFSIPHLVLMIFQLAVSSLVSAPFYPLGGSPAFLMSYMRPVRFWERHYNTNRLKDDNLRLADSLDRSSASTLNNLNSIFYEHLARTLSQTLYDDIQYGRYGGDLENGDMFILISDKLTAVLHIIQLGNGFVSFQLRGLEFKGTYCQERELEAITEDPSDNERRVWHPLSENGLALFRFRAWWSMRWRTWEILNQSTVLQTYSISLNPAASMFHVFAMRQALIKSLVTSLLYYLIEAPQLESWLSSNELLEPLMALPNTFVARDFIFSSNNIDYDGKRGGISMTSFQKMYAGWIKTCVRHRKRRTRKALKLNSRQHSSSGSAESADVFSADESGSASAASAEAAKTSGDDADRAPYFLSSADPRTAFFSPRLLRLCFALSLVARRALLASSSPTSFSMAGDNLMYTFYQMFRGDVRITAAQDEWVFRDFSLLELIKRGARMALKLHQDYIALAEEYTDLDEQYGVMEEYAKNLVICHEGEAEWTDAVMADRPSLLSMRKAIDDKNQTEEHYIVMLNMKYSKFRTVKINRESVRGLWAAQQHELIFYGNENSERGSIQQMRPAIRNLVTQACDLPVGYPIFISPVTTSYTRAPSPLDVGWWTAELRRVVGLASR